MNKKILFVSLCTFLFIAGCGKNEELINESSTETSDEITALPEINEVISGDIIRPEDTDSSEIKEAAAEFSSKENIYIPTAQSIEFQIKQNIENKYNPKSDASDAESSIQREDKRIYLVHFHEAGRNEKTWNSTKVFYNKKELPKDILSYPHLNDEFTLNDTTYIILQKSKSLKVDIVRANNFMEDSFIKDNYDYIEVTEFIAYKKD